MKVMYVEHRMEDMDRDKDGFLTLSEYIGKCYLILYSDMAKYSLHTEDVWPKDQRDSEPEWLPREKSNFASRLDN